MTETTQPIRRVLRDEVRSSAQTKRQDVMQVRPDTVVGTSACVWSGYNASCSPAWKDTEVRSLCSEEIMRVAEWGVKRAKHATCTISTIANSTQPQNKIQLVDGPAEPLMAVGPVTYRTVHKTVRMITTIRPKELKVQTADFVSPRRFTPQPYVVEHVSDGPAIVHTPKIDKPLLRGIFQKQGFVQAAELATHMGRIARREHFHKINGFSKPSTRQSRIRGEALVTNACRKTGKAQVVRFLNTVLEYHTERGVEIHKHIKRPVGGTFMGKEMKALALEAEKKSFKESKPWVQSHALKTPGNTNVWQTKETNTEEVLRLLAASREEPFNDNTVATLKDGNRSILGIKTGNTCGPDALATLYFRRKTHNANDIQKMIASYNKNKLSDGMTCLFGTLLGASSVRMPCLIISPYMLGIYLPTGDPAPDTVLSVVVHSTVERVCRGNKDAPGRHWYVGGYTTYGELDKICPDTKERPWTDMEWSTLITQVKMEQQTPDKPAVVHPEIKPSFLRDAKPEGAAVAGSTETAKTSEACELDDEAVVGEDVAAYEDVVQWVEKYLESRRREKEPKNSELGKAGVSGSASKAEVPTPSSASLAVPNVTTSEHATQATPKTVHVVSPTVTSDSEKSTTSSSSAEEEALLKTLADLSDCDFFSDPVPLSTKIDHNSFKHLTAAAESKTATSATPPVDIWATPLPTWAPAADAAVPSSFWDKPPAASAPDATVFTLKESPFLKKWMTTLEADFPTGGNCELNCDVCRSRSGLHDCPRCAKPVCGDCRVYRAGFRRWQYGKQKSTSCLWRALERVTGVSDRVCFECARLIDMRKKQQKKITRPVGGAKDNFPRLCAPSTFAHGYVIVPRLEEASIGRSGDNAYAMGEMKQDGTRHCWYSMTGEHRVVLSPAHTLGWHLAYESGIFQVYVNVPVTPITGKPFPMNVAGVITWRGLLGHHTIYLANSVIQPFVLQLRSQPATFDGFGISMNSQFRAVTAALSAVNWLHLHPYLAVEGSGSLPGSVIAHVYSRVTPAEWNYRTALFKMKLFLSSGRLFAITEEFGCEAVLSFVWALYATGLGIPLTKAFMDAFSGMASQTLDAPAWLKIFIAVTCGPYGFIMSLCSSFLTCKPYFRVAIGAILTTVVVVAVPFVSIPALVAAIFAKWAASGIALMACGLLYSAGKFLWDNRLYISRRHAKSRGVNANPRVQPYGVPHAQNVRGGTYDDGCVKAVVRHDLTPIERVVGHLEHGNKVTMFVEMAPDISDHYSSADSGFADAVQMRLTKKRASPVQVNARGKQHRKSTLTPVEWGVRKRAADRAEGYLRDVEQRATALWYARFDEFNRVYGSHMLDTVLHDVFPVVRLRKSSYPLNPLFVEWWTHLDSSKKRIYENEIARIYTSGIYHAPSPSCVSAKANVKVEIMPFLTAMKSLKPRIIQYMPPEFMAHVAPQCWAYGDCVKKSTGENIQITSGCSVDEYSDLMNAQLRKITENPRHWHMVANGDDNGLVTGWKSDSDSHRLYNNVVRAYQFHGRDVTCHAKRTIIDSAYCSSTFIPVQTPEGIYYRHYMLPFKQAYKAFVFILSAEHQYIAKRKMSLSDYDAAILRANADASVSRYFMFRGDPFMEPITLALLKRCGREYVTRWSAAKSAKWFDSHLEHAFGWKAGLRVYERNEVDDALIWDAHEYRTGIPRSALMALRDEIVSTVESCRPSDKVVLENMATFVEGLTVEQGLKVLSGYRKRPDWIGHGDCLFVESDNGSYDASTTMYTHNRMISMQESVVGHNHNFTKYNDVRRRCRVRLQCERGFGAWTIVGQMMSGWPDTTISNSFSNIWEMITAMELHGGF